MGFFDQRRTPAERGSSLVEPGWGRLSATPEASDAAPAAETPADPWSFAVIYERYLDPVYRYCYLRLETREAAEDATSEVFLKALGGLSARRDGPLAAWLFRIAHNVVVDRYRRRRATAPLEAAGDPPDAAPTPEEAVIEHAERAALRRVLPSLPDDQRAAVELHLAGWSGRQIAEALGKSTSAVKQLRFRAVGRLRTRLLAEEGAAAEEAYHD